MTRHDRRACARIEPLLSAWIDGGLDDGAADRVGAHLERCGACADVVSGLLRLAGATAELLQPATSRRPDAAPAPRASADRFAGTLERFADERRRALGRVARALLAGRVLRARGPAPAEPELLARGRALLGELVGLESDQGGGGACLVEALRVVGEHGGVDRAFAALRAFEESTPLAPALPAAADGAAAVRWARAEIDLCLV